MFQDVIYPTVNDPGPTPANWLLDRCAALDARRIGRLAALHVKITTIGLDLSRYSKCDMDGSLMPRQMINVEIAARAGNSKAANMLKVHVPKPEQRNLKIAFNCECSDPACKDRIMLTLREYEELHHDFARFIVKNGHAEPKIEHVADQRKDMSIVHKPSLSP